MKVKLSRKKESKRTKYIAVIVGLLNLLVLFGSQINYGFINWFSFIFCILYLVLPTIVWASSSLDWDYTRNPPKPWVDVLVMDYEGNIYTGHYDASKQMFIKDGNIDFRASFWAYIPKTNIQIEK